MVQTPPMPPPHVIYIYKQGFPWLVESLKSEVGTLLSEKKAAADRVLEHCIDAEVNWIFVTEADLNAIEREVAVGMASNKANNAEAEKHWTADLAQIVLVNEESASTSSLFEPGRETKIRQLAVDAYIRLMLRRVFYAVPMNIRHLLITEFRKDLVR